MQIDPRQVCTYLENKEGNHNKFYLVVVINDHGAYTLRSAFGRINLTCIENVGKTYNSRKSAISVADALIASKLAKGYRVAPLSKSTHLPVWFSAWVRPNTENHVQPVSTSPRPNKSPFYAARLKNAPWRF